MDAAPLKRKLVHHYWKEASRRNGSDPPPTRDGPVDNGSSNSGGVSEEDLSNSDADQAHVVNSNNAQNRDRAVLHLEHNASNNGSAFGEGGVAGSAADQNWIVNSIDTQNQARADFSLRPRGLQNGVGLNRSEQHAGSSKPVPYTSVPTLGPKAEDAVGGYSSISAMILAVSNQVLLEPGPMRVGREPALLGLDKLYKEGNRDGMVGVL